ncbi:MAG TPA: hypothetical protein DFS52_11910 [Myxococcales bacterium]|jgi:hypothetical protein|nr:hypothetical protein [Myxococcales bacterium]
MRAMNLLRTLLLALVALSLGACPNRVAPLEIKVVKPSDPDPLEGVAFIRVRVLDDLGNIVVEKRVDAGSGKADLEELPSEVPLRVQVAGLTSDESIVSYGLSPVFEIPGDLGENPEPIQRTVFLRAVERFSPAIAAYDPSVPSTLSVPRAGHTATLLDDGRVLIAGGFQAANRVSHSWKYLASVEVYDPATGAVTTEIPDMMFKSGGGTTPRAFHTAVKLPSGQVLISGGEATTGAGAPATMMTVNNSILFDPTVAEAPWAPIVTMKKWRSRHTATREQNGRVLLYGGLDWGEETNRAELVDTFEWFDSEINRFRLPTDYNPFKAIGHAALPVAGGQFVAIAGGATVPGGGGSPDLADGDSIRFFKYEKEADKIQPLSSGDLKLDPKRTWAAVAPIGAAQFLVLGGFKDFDPARPWDLFPGNPHNASDLIALKPLKRDSGPSVDVPRGHICAVTLQDGRVLAIGGRGQPDVVKNPALIEALPHNTVISEREGSIRSSRGLPLAESRYFHTCTLLNDGSVLVTGGMHEVGTNITTLSSMEIFVPYPAE